MDIWIADKIGYIDGYSLMEQPEQTKLEVEQEPADFTNWRFDGETLVYDPENAPKIKEELTEIEQLKHENEHMKEQLSELTDAVLFMSENIGGAN